MGNRIPWAFQNSLIFSVWIFWKGIIHIVKVWIICGQQNILRRKSHEKIFRVDPGKKSKKVRNFFPGSSVLRNWSNIWEVWQFSINPWCVRVYGKLPNLTNLASVSENRGSRKYFRCSCLAQGRLCILEWSNRPEILVPGLK